MKVLIVEDDEIIAETLKIVLCDQHYVCEVASDGQSAWDLIQVFAYDLILLDVMLPKLDGISLCRRLRSHGYHMPILLLTGRDSGHDKATGLDAGADDYVVKPFDCEELIARVRALLRRGDAALSPILEWGDLRLDPSTCEVTYGTNSLHLTPKEYSLLELFLRHNRRVFSCGAILEHLWSFDKTPGEEAVRTQIKGLRHKLKIAGAPADWIETVYGIGYRLKPIAHGVGTHTYKHPLQVNRDEKSQETPSNVEQQTLLAVAGVWDKFKQKISDLVQVLEQAATMALQEQMMQELRSSAQQEAHNLAGSLGTFGFTEGSRLARKIELLLQSSQTFSESEARHLNELVKALRQEMDFPPAALVSLAQSHQDERSLLLIVDSDRLLAEQLINEAEIRGLRAEAVTNLAQARLAIARELPHLVLLDLAVTEYGYNLAPLQDGLNFLAELRKRHPLVPVLVFTDRDNLAERLEVARLGGRAFLHKPIPPAQVLETVTQALQRAEMSADAKVMVVDDDPLTLATLRSLLQPWGLKVITLEDPLRFWETLEAFEPELLILDLNMPHLSGIDLCQVVRNDSRWSRLPVLFLTAHADATTVNQVFAVGADDFVSKPIIGPELVTRIINRLDRIKLLRNLAEIDPLTTLYNRRKATQELDKFLRLAKRHNQTLCLTVLDLDHFKQINDQYGHMAGDAVLRQFAQMLQQSFRTEDVIARWGGEEFVIGMYAMSKSDGVNRLTKVLEALRKEEFMTSAHTTLQLTFSAGVAQYPEDGTDIETLYQSADAALYQAKASGRNHVLPVQAPVPKFSLTPNLVNRPQI